MLLLLSFYIQHNFSFVTHERFVYSNSINWSITYIYVLNLAKNQDFLLLYTIFIRPQKRKTQLSYIPITYKKKSLNLYAGHGNLTPRTSEGKIVTMLYALVGVPLMLMCLSSLGGFLADALQCAYSKLCHPVVQRSSALNHSSNNKPELHECIQQEDEVRIYNLE